MLYIYLLEGQWLSLFRMVIGAAHNYKKDEASSHKQMKSRKIFTSVIH